MIRCLALALALIGLPGIAQAKPTLTVYTYESFVTEWGPGAKIKENFEKTCDCTLEWVGITDGVALLNRLKLEGVSTTADVVLGLDTTLTAEAKGLGLFGPHGLTLEGLSLPVAWNDDTFVPYDYAHFAVIYDTQAMPQPPGSLDELVNGDASAKIILQDPRSSTPGLGFLLWMKAVYGDKAPEAWEKLRPRVLTTTPGWSEAYGLFTKGEAPMVLSYTTSPAYHMVAENTERYQAATFSEGHYLQIEVAGLIDQSPERALGQRFLAFMTTPGFQDTIPTMNWMLPVAKTSEPLPDAFGKLVTPAKTFLDDPDTVAKNRRAWIDEWLKAMTQ